MKLTELDSPFFDIGLDVLFVGLNPPTQSNSNGHYFSGKNSLFFKRLYEAGLIVNEVEKSSADEIIFGDNKLNFDRKKYGVIDAVPFTEQTKSSKIRVTNNDYYNLLDKLIISNAKKIVLMHSKVSNKFEKIEKIKLNYGNNGQILDYLEIKAEIFKVPFPNGSRYKKEEIIDLYSKIIT